MDKSILDIIIRAKDEASAVITKSTASVSASATAADKTAQSYKTLSLITAGALVGALGVAVTGAANLQSQMVRLATSAGESQQNLAADTAGLLKISTETATSTTALGDALYVINSGGQHGADGLKVLKAAAEGAKTENADLKTVADAVTSVLVDYHLKASDAADVTSKLVAATAAGKTSFEQLSAAMPAILPVASAAHVSLSDILGDLASMTVHGMSAEQSAQNLADVIRHMQNPTSVQAKELALLGLTTTQLADDMKNKGLSGTLQEISGKIQNLMPPGSDKVILNLKSALNGLSPSVRNLSQKLFDGSLTAKEYAKAAMQLDPISAKQAQSFGTLAGSMHRIGDKQMSGAQVMQNYGQALAKATGDATGLNVALMLSGENAGVTNKAVKSVAKATAEAGGHVAGWSDIQGTFNFKLKAAGLALSNTGKAIGLALLPAMTSLLNGVLKVVVPIAEWTTKHQKLAAMILGSVAGIASFVAVVLTAHAAFKKVSTTIDVLKAGVKAFGKESMLTSAITKVWSGVQLAFNAIMDANPIALVILAIAALIAITVLVITHWKAVSAFFQRFWPELVSGAQWLWNSFVGFFRSLPGAILGALGNLGSLLYNAGGDIIRGLVNGITGFAHLATNAVRNVGSSLVSGFKSLLGIHSPSTVFAEAGKNIGQGLANGIGSTTGLVKSATNHLMGNASGNITAGGAISPPSGGLPTAVPTGSASSGVTINAGGITVNIGMYAGTQSEKQKVATEIWQALMQIARSHNMAANVPNLGIRPV